MKNFLSCLFLSLLYLAAGISPLNAQNWNPVHAIGSLNGTDHYSPVQTPAPLVELFPAAQPNTGLDYQWESSVAPLNGFLPVVGANQSSFTFSSPITQTTWFKRKTIFRANGS